MLTTARHNRVAQDGIVHPLVEEGVFVSEPTQAIIGTITLVDLLIVCTAGVGRCRGAKSVAHLLGGSPE